MKGSTSLFFSDCRIIYNPRVEHVYMDIQMPKTYKGSSKDRAPGPPSVLLCP